MISVFHAAKHLQHHDWPSSKPFYGKNAYRSVNIEPSLSSQNNCSSSLLNLLLSELRKEFSLNYHGLSREVTLSEHLKKNNDAGSIRTLSKLQRNKIDIG